MILKTLTAAAIAAGTMLVAATPAQAVITTFADFSALAGDTANLYWKNNGTTASNGTGGSLYTIATNSGTTAAANGRAVSFSFLQPSIAPFITDVTALFKLSATVVNTPATRTVVSPTLTILIQEVATVTTGTFSFLSTAPITIGSTTYAAGSNLLSGSFTQSQIVGARGGSAGSYTASTLAGSSITYTSDFLSFVPTVDRDFSLSLSAISSVLQAIPSNGNPTNALRTFRALSTGSFSTDPAPIVTAIPEPAVWGLMIVGFGMVGLQTRRRGRNATVAA